MEDFLYTYPKISDVQVIGVPDYFEFKDTFPMTVTGKIQKFKMREISIKELGLDEAAAIRTA